MSYAVTTLLELDYTSSATSTANIIEDATDGSGVVAVAADALDIESFHIAYDALNAKSTTINRHEGSSLSNLVNGGDMSGSQGLGASIQRAMKL